jgi:DNA mismatch repair protein MutL
VRIRILEDAVIDRIAAGEVVERPASVVKELVENALDAGATRVEVRLGQGGASLIQVRDDGSGMDREDAMLCLERHATSKIRSEADLVGVRTLGFRGEAVPSIASVSRFQIRTRRAEDEVGTEVRVDGGTLEHVGPVAAPVGTEITVRSLFQHVPARRKFLRSAQTEVEHCVEALVRQALLRPDVDLLVLHDGRDLLRAPVTTDPVRRIADLLGKDASLLVPVSHTAAGISVTGHVAPVGLHRPSSTGAVYTYVNGRFVRDAVVRRAITEAYRGALPQGRHPIVVLSIEVPGDTLDVNVHPAKTEVRFRNPSEVVRVVGAALHEALHTRHTRARPADEPEQPLLVSPTWRGGASDPSPSLSRAYTRPSALPPELDQVSIVPDLGSGVDQVILTPARAALAAQPVLSEVPLAWVDVGSDEPAAPRVPSSPTAYRPDVPTASKVSPTATAAPRVELLLRVGDLALVRRGDAPWLVDLSSLATASAVALLSAQPVDSVPLLLPHTVELGRADVSRVIAAAESLSALGVDVGALGPGSLAVLAMPADLPNLTAGAALSAAASALASGALAA